MSPSAPAEPSPERLANPLLRYFLATRPAFLGITLVSAWLVLSVSAGWLSAWALVGLPAMLPAAHAAANLHAHADQPHRLRPAIRGSIAAAHLHAFLLSAGLLASAPG